MIAIADECAATLANAKAQARAIAAQAEVDSMFAVAESLARMIAGDAQEAANALMRSLIYSDNARRLRAIAG